jgi:hypothetical protein
MRVAGLERPLCLHGRRKQQADAAQASPCQLAQELRPDRFGLGCSDLHAEHLTSAVGVDARRDDDRDRDDAPPATNLQVGGIDPQVWPFALDGAVQEGFDLVVDLSLPAAKYLYLPEGRRAGTPGSWRCPTCHGLGEIIDGSGRTPWI